MSLYLATIAEENAWQDDEKKAGWILVRYKRELRWAKPCLRLGSFEMPDRIWCVRNRTRFKVWVATEQVSVKAREEDSLIYMGFYPIGAELSEDNLPKPTSETASYPDVHTTEFGNFRIVINKRTSTIRLDSLTDDAGDAVQLKFKLDSEAGTMRLQWDNDSYIEIEEGIVTNMAARVNLAGEDDFAVLGQAWLDKHNTHTHPSIMGPTSPPTEPVLAADVLSTKVKLGA